VNVMSAQSTAIGDGVPKVSGNIATAARVGLPSYMEVETSRRCNRTCQWCPNGEHNARRRQQLME
jgi:hypothetical protein